MMKICIVAPMYNEEEVAKESIETISSYIKDLPYETKLVVVNDGSTDRTKEIMKHFIRGNGEAGLELISHETNKGYGSALRSGIRFAIRNNYDYIVFMDSDLTNHPRYLKDFYNKIGEGWDYIKATRYSKGGAVAGVPINHRIISKMGNFIAKILYGLQLNDLTNGFRAVKVEILGKIDLKEDSFAVIMEELYKAKGLTNSFCEIPYVLTARKKGQGRTRLSYSPKMCVKYLNYALKASKVRGKRC